MRFTIGLRAGVVSSCALTGIGLSGCGIPQSAVVSVTSRVRIMSTCCDSLTPLPHGIVPKLFAEDVRQALLERSPAESTFLGDDSKFTVKLGLYDTPYIPAGSQKPFYVFSGGPVPASDCPSSTAPGPPEPCYFVIAAGADDASVRFNETSWVNPAPQVVGASTLTADGPGGTRRSTDHHRLTITAGRRGRDLDRLRGTLRYPNDPAL